MKEKSCLVCGVLFKPTSTYQKYCGNFKEKTGCSYEKYKERNRNRRIKPTKEYRNLHYWVEKIKGKASACIFCGKKENIQWANKYHTYQKKIEDYISLCVKCHEIYDKNILNKKQGRTINKK